MGEGAGKAHLAVQAEKLKRLADDLDTMQEYLDRQVRRMDGVVDRIEGRWRGPAAEEYRSRHRGAAEDAVRIREVMKVLAQAVRLSEGGFTAQEMDTLRRFRRARADVDVEAEAAALSTPHTAPEPTNAPTNAPESAPRSRIHDI
ncbi:WXG100 family type VII secretion target [Streptomyces sp. ISL-36]|uniref:WXG100 family type VII secretion target n=1 Tax=Streptomyces sp. ISL-36 TaxID=2819182 RepID=UPI001BEC8B2F|nr:WXG100 family type VII secretion target [Streptomyces sp. ISL-36]MBT2442626.1 WXG100 family type VII secretion target [Streptomyces sp. ISL-36]